MKVIGIIPARGGSKGIPRKNIKELAGKPLIVYSIEAALASSLIDDVVVTTDDDEITEIGEKESAEVIRRPADLARDDSLVMDAVRHVLSNRKKRGLTYDLLVLLEPTAPFRTADDIDNTVELLIDEEADSAATFSETAVPPTRIWRIKDKTPVPFISGADPFLPRQKQEKGFALNGMVYVLKTVLLNQYPGASSFLLGESVANIIPRERVVDIDTPKDLFFAEQFITEIT